jgi:hypothetical protein
MIRTKSGLPKHCTYQKDRYGQRRVRFRRTGVSVYLTGIPWSEDFMRQYAAALEREQGQRAQIGVGRTIPGSFSAACVSYYGSPEFCGLKESTRVGRRYILEPFREKNGHRPVRDLQREHIRAILGQMQDRPHAANNLLKVLLVVLDHAVSQGMIASNPARGVRRYPTRNKDGYRAWSEEDIAASSRPTRLVRQPDSPSPSRSTPGSGAATSSSSDGSTTAATGSSFASRRPAAHSQSPSTLSWRAPSPPRPALI